ncbi:MAG TPA: LuxR C-terminal-related transcriptional regulator [Solirubrobacteraceae bacterium]|nr:LuxR C-terminal-related transcriptional regulator [Solirubrobacteraceae bacterium]
MAVSTVGQRRLAASLQGALTQAEVTRAYLAAVPAVIGARGRGFYQLDLPSGAPAAVAADVSADFLQDYEERGRAGDPVLEFVQQHLRPVDNTRACAEGQWRDSPVCDVLAHAGFFHSLEAPVIVSGEFIGTINFARARGDRPFSAADMSAAMLAAEQLGLAVQRARRFEQVGERVTVLEAALDRLPQAVVVTDPDGQALYANQAASRPPEGQDASLLELAGAQIAGAMDSFRAHNQRVVVGSAADPAGKVRVVVKTVRLPGESGASLTLIYPCEDAPAARLPLWDVLSPREQQIAEWVSQGLTTKQIAARAVVSENTVKQHLKRIFSKTSVSNRAELVQRIWTARSPQG